MTILIDTLGQDPVKKVAGVPFAMAVTHGDGVVRLNCLPWKTDQPISLIPAVRERPFGLAYLTPFRAGLRMEFRLRLSLPKGMTCRVEVSGFATRFQRAFLMIDASGLILDQGDELANVQAFRDSSGYLELRFLFRSPQSMNEWIYIYFQGTGPVGVWPEVHGFSGEPRDLNPAYRMFELATEQECGTWFALQAAFFFRHYFQFEFELHRPGAVLRRLEVLAPVRVNGLRWLTGSKQAHDGHGLAPEPARFPLRAPGLADRFGLELSTAGHQIFGLFSEPVEFHYRTLEETDAIRDFRIRVRFDDGVSTELSLCPEEHEDRTILWNRLKNSLGATQGGHFLEVGGRGEGSVKIRGKLGPEWRYTALDIHPGPNVDIVGDAHHLSDFLAPNSVDVVYSADVMEHFISPWRFVLEANRVLKEGGIFFSMVPNAWPLHAEPWDFWRMSDHAWPGLLNPGTGFELLETGVLGRTAMVTFMPVQSGRTRGQHDPAYEHTFAIARKIGEARVRWDAYDAEWIKGRYEREL